MKIDLEEENLKGSLLGLVIALVEVIRDVLEHQAIRRMDGENLNDEEIERLGTSLLRLTETIEELKEEQGIQDVVNNVHKQLNSLVNGSIFKGDST